MNATNLLLPDGTASHVWFCEKCRIVKSNQAEAEACCRPAICEVCGQEMKKTHYWHKCDKCRNVEFEAKHIKDEAARYSKAEKVAKFDGWVYCDGFDNHNGGFFESLQELIDFCQDEEEDMPEYCWACNAIAFVHIEISDILQSIEENGYEDFDADDCTGLDALKVAVKTFNEANLSILKYEPNYDLAVVLPTEIREVHNHMLLRTSLD
jgi:hypothetical protein